MLWLKAFHIIAMTCWFAGLFYLPRLFVYHAMSEDAISLERFKTMERKLFYGIMTPAAGVTLLLGLAMTYMNWAYLKTQAWFHLKIVLVALLFIYHDLCKRYLKALASDQSNKSHVFFRFFNEVPVLLLVAIVVLVVVRPF